MTEEMERMARKAAREAVKEWLIIIGVDAMDTSELIEMQKDFAFIRRQRYAGEQMGSWFKGSVIMAVVTGMLTALWLGIQAAFGK